MNIRDEILAIFPNCDRRYLDKYIDIVTSPKMYANGEFTENHHILPKSIWRKYANIKNMNGIVQLYLFMTTYMLMFISQCAQTHYGMQYKHYQISMQMEQENFQAIKK